MFFCCCSDAYSIREFTSNITKLWHILRFAFIYDAPCVYALQYKCVHLLLFIYITGIKLRFNSHTNMFIKFKSRNEKIETFTLLTSFLLYILSRVSRNPTSWCRGCGACLGVWRPEFKSARVCFLEGHHAHIPLTSWQREVSVLGLYSLSQAPAALTEELVALSWLREFRSSSSFHCTHHPFLLNHVLLGLSCFVI